MVNLAVVWLVGVLTAIPVVAWWARDVARIHAPNWYWTGHRRRPWQWAILLGWIAGGWIAMIVVLVWSQSAVRRDLLTDIGDSQNRRRSTDRPLP